jgi:hypothetical protein
MNLHGLKVSLLGPRLSLLGSRVSLRYSITISTLTAAAWAVIASGSIMSLFRSMMIYERFKDSVHDSKANYRVKPGRKKWSHDKKLHFWELEAFPIEHDSSCRNELFKFFVTKATDPYPDQIMPAEDPDSHALNKHPHHSFKMWCEKLSTLGLSEGIKWFTTKLFTLYFFSSPSSRRWVEMWYTFADFFQNWDFSRGFL